MWGSANQVIYKGENSYLPGKPLVPYFLRQPSCWVLGASSCKKKIGHKRRSRYRYKLQAITPVSRFKRAAATWEICSLQPWSKRFGAHFTRGRGTWGQ